MRIFRDDCGDSNGTIMPGSSVYRDISTGVLRLLMPLLESPSLDAKDRSRVTIIARATQRVERMIADLLDLARGHLGSEIPVQLRAEDLGDVACAAVEEARQTYPGRLIQVTTTGDLRGRFDRDRILQAIGNLITNAVQHGQDPIRVDV